MSYKIITDSCCDLTDQQVRELNIARVPLSVLWKGENRADFSNEADLKTFYDSLREGEMGSTSAVNPEGWKAAMESALSSGQDVLALCFSSGLSTTYQSAVIAAQELRGAYPDRKINVIDTLCAALGQGLLVLLACRKRDAGLSLEELAAWVEENKLHMCHWVTVDSLNHLKRGGRISATTALVGTMLNIKPIIYVDNEGKLINTAKVRGRKTAIEYLANKVGQTGTDLENATVTIAHGDCPEDAAALEAMLKEKYGVKEVITGYVGAVIGTHTGPGVLVVFYLGEHR